jgi:hypothetical protein
MPQRRHDWFGRCSKVRFKHPIFGALGGLHMIESDAGHFGEARDNLNVVVLESCMTCRKLEES